jgi:acyl-[acyl-carrier-protein] desaturase
LETVRLEQVSRGFSPGQNSQGDMFAYSLFDSVLYVTFQELATRVSYRNTGKACSEPIGAGVRGREPAHDLLSRR